jgi:Protein of unknown function (DUF3995)
MMCPTPSDPRPEATLGDHAAGAAAAAGLLAIGALHAAWGAGSSWPMASRAELSRAVLGSRGLQRGGAAACYTVAGALGTAAALVAGWPKRAGRPRRVAVAGIAAVLAGRGALGLAGRTDLVSPVSTGQAFRRLDRRYYSPLCLTLSALTALSLRRRNPARRPGQDVRPSDA